ncbi:unnamed protein product [Nippostrongylus brasiliensis]|uniref:SCP domain-containing protein n=1 Tax=Nippostrongylus brasiliensis TaxID=27835 RepID=A0A0N4XDE0_NIPBR|nr:unnamed protein product [Nippostrongylus brasiliensis]
MFQRAVVRWNCITEQNLYTQLQKLTSCGDDRLIYKQFGVNNKLIERNSNSCTNLTLAAPEYWYTGSLLYETDATTTRFRYYNKTGTPLEADFANFIMWDTTDMACTYRNCPDDNTKMIVVCAYNMKGAINNNIVYFMSGRNWPTLCLRPSNTQRVCRDGIMPCLENNLCDATTPNADSLDQLFDGVPFEDGPDMDQFSRYAALQMHNYYRRKVARGWAADGKGGYAPSAVDMPLLTYNLSLEDSAIVHANKCALALEALGPIGQAIGQIIDNSLSRTEALEKVITGWFGEIGNPGIGDDLTFTAAMNSTLTNGVRNYANMVYDQHIEVGCGTASCQTGITVVCHYQPKPGKKHDRYGDGRRSSDEDSYGWYIEYVSSSEVYEILEPLETDFVEEYVPVPPQVRRLRTPMIYRRPIEDRLTLPPRPQVVYVPVPVTRTQRKPLSSRGSGGRGTQRNQGTKNNVRGVMNNVNFKNHAAGRGGRAGRGAASGRGHYAPLPKKSISELDKELEDYMKKSKHPKIVV